MLGEGGEIAAIPKDGMGSEDFLQDGELGGETGVDVMRIVVGAAGEQALALSLWAAGDDDLQSGDQRKACFVEKRNIRHEEWDSGIGLRLVLCLQTGLAHHGVENLFQDPA